MFQGRSASEFLELFKRRKPHYVPPIVFCYLGMRRQAADRGAKRFLKLIGKKSAKPSEPPNIGKILSTMTSSDILANAPLSAKLKVFSPVEAAEFAVSYLHMTLQLIPLRERWGMRKVKLAHLILDLVPY